ncbi:MAG: DUF3301 domain-containing protein [Gammaproteobacteria bacterium]|nr:DUF3301 domain-containing protein [Gammaproteobacteria bacterium]
MSPLLTLLLLLAAVYYWWSASHAKEAAIAAGRKACERAGLQFLDDTVEQRRVRLKRGQDGNLGFCRYYVFEFTVDGDRRYEGRLILLGERVIALDMDAHRLPDNVVRFGG